MDNNSPTKAFTYMFKDNKFWQKYWTLFGICVSYLVLLYIRKSDFVKHNHYELLLCSIFIIIIKTSIGGYFINAVKSIAEQRYNIIYPFYNLKHSFKQGLFFYIAILTSLPTILIIIIVLFLLPELNNIALKGLTIAFCVIGSLIVAYFAPAFFRYFAITEKITSFYCFKDIFNSIKVDSRYYRDYVLNYYGVFFLLCVYIFVVVTAITVILSIILKNFAYNDRFTQIMVYIADSFIMPYIFMVITYLIAKCVREPDYIEENVQ